MRLFVGTNLETGAQYLVSLYDDGSAEVATRSSVDTRERWSPPVALVEER